MKRLIANRPEWKRILQKRFYCSFLSTPEYTGHVTLLCMDQIREPLWIRAGDDPTCIVNTGYSWLQHFPLGEHFAITTMFDEREKIIQWYIDICLRQGVTENNIPWFDDLFLDVEFTPNGDLRLLDADELDDALDTGEISKSEYDLALCESERIMAQIKQGKFAILGLCEQHRLSLLQTPQMKNI